MQSNSSKGGLALIYAATIFISAFLLFQIQPMISKAILPWFGGTPAVWTTCLLFFQSILFFGYAYAHFSNTFLTRKQQGIVHLLVIAAALAIALFGILPRPSQQPAGDESPTLAILAILAVTIGLPYFVLSSTGPLLQAWFANSFPDRTAYRLYALSNIGSLLALLSYPFVFEHMFDLPNQGNWWSAGFVAFGILCAYVAWQVWLASHRDGTTTTTEGAEQAAAGLVVSKASTSDALTPPGPLHYMLWLLLPAFGTATFMATCNHITTDMPVVSLLLVIPLALYLLTFIIVFDHPRWYHPLWTAALTLVFIYAASIGIGRTELYDFGMTGWLFKVLAGVFGVAIEDADGNSLSPAIDVNFTAAVVINFIAMFGICFLCHGELARLRPHTRYLTAYFLMMSAGGALGGMAVSLIAPHVFRTMLEWPLTTMFGAFGAIALLLYALVCKAVETEPDSTGRLNSPWLARIALVLLLVPASFYLLDVGMSLFAPSHNVVFQARNFFGTITVRNRREAPAEGSKVDGKPYAIELRNGTTIHGSQFLAQEKRGQPTSYYATTSGIGKVLNFYHNNPPPGGVRIGDVGLGTGTLAAYAMKGDFLTFYEINPAVIDMSTSGEYFTYVSDCRARGATCDIKLGDARLALEHEANTPNLPRYHVLVLDAFSSDSIPTHLVTIEACKHYLPRIARADGEGAEGALVIHVSNRYLDLDRVVQATADELEMPCIKIENEGVNSQLILGATWMVLTRNEALMAVLKPFESEERIKTPVPWTDSHSSLFDILKHGDD